MGKTDKKLISLQNAIDGNARDLSKLSQYVQDTFVKYLSLEEFEKEQQCFALITQLDELRFEIANCAKNDTVEKGNNALRAMTESIMKKLSHLSVTKDELKQTEKEIKTFCHQQFANLEQSNQHKV